MITQIIVCSLVVMSAVLYVSLFELEKTFYLKRKLKAIDRFVSPEHRGLLKTKMKLPGKTPLKYYAPLSLTGLTLFAIAEMIQHQMDIHPLLIMVAVFGSAIHVLFLIIIVLMLVSEEFEIRKDPHYLLPSLWDYLDDKEGFFLFLIAGRPNEYDSDLRSKTVLHPESLVPFLTNRDAIIKYADMRIKITEAYQGKDDMLSPEEKRKQRQLVENLLEKSAGFKTFAQNILDAIDKEAHQYRQKYNVEKSHIQSQFVVIQEKLEAELEALDNPVSVEKPIHFGETAEETVMKELKRVKESELVSEQLKIEASQLIEQIKDSQTQESLVNEREKQEMNAQTVIRASKIFFGMKEEEKREAIEQTSLKKQHQ